MMFYMMKVVVIYITRIIIKDIPNESISDEVTGKKKEIEKLKKEAEMYNTPNKFVKHSKIERMVIKLQKELDIRLQLVEEGKTEYYTWNEVKSHLKKIRE